MSGRDGEEPETTRRRFGTGTALAIGTILSGGGAYGAWRFSQQMLEKGGQPRDHGPDYDETDYDPDETYEMPDEGVTYTPTPGAEPVDSWDDALPGECNLDSSQRNWLVAQVDSHNEMYGDEFFDYVDEGRVDLRDDGSELRMLVDEDGDGRYDQGYNIPDVC
jgi:hypothetical protein